MTLTELVTFIRQRYNAVGDNFFSDDEMYRYIWAAEMELAHKAYVIESTLTTTSVDGQREYAYPTNTLAIKRVTYNGRKLAYATFREDDTLTLGNSAATTEGEPIVYSLWDSTLYLRPIPDTSALSIVIFSYSEPQEVTSSSVLEVPTIWQLGLADYCLHLMAGKDKNFQAAEMYKKAWDATVFEAIKWSRKRLRGDSFHSVKDESAMIEPPFIGSY
jgi:hypothetical protein